MEKLLLIQLLSAFLVGGMATALVTFLAEKSSNKIAAIFLSIPTSPVVGLFFVGLILSPEEVAKVVPMTPLSLALTLVFICSYIYFAKVDIKLFESCRLNKLSSIAFSLIGALITWALCSMPLAIYKFNNVTVSLLLFVLIAFTAHYLLAIRHQVTESETSKVTYTHIQKFLRFLLIGCVMATVVLLTKFLGAFWGALFSFFPAKYMSALVILHYYYDRDFLIRTFQNIGIGITSPLVYSLSLYFTYPSLGVGLGTLASLSISSSHVLLLMFVLNGGLIGLQKRLKAR